MHGRFRTIWKVLSKATTCAESTKSFHKQRNSTSKQSDEEERAKAKAEIINWFALLQNRHRVHKGNVEG
jgi:hypothetical protein